MKVSFSSLLKYFNRGEKLPGIRDKSIYKHKSTQANRKSAGRFNQRKSGKTFPGILSL